MSKRVLCKFFAHGACLKGEHCEFSHDWKDPPNNICTYYQKGFCSYASRCRYEHVKPSRSESAASSSSSVSHPSRATSSGITKVPGVMPELSALSRPFLPPNKTAWNPESVCNDSLENDEVDEPRNLKPADRSICSFAAAGNCPRGEKCPHIHGDTCPTCGKQCLHPFRPEEREEHMKSCEKKQKHLEALRRSQEIECSVCLDRVLSKPTAAERKFGLLSECDHPFCISCIRNWRMSFGITHQKKNRKLLIATSRNSSQSIASTLTLVMATAHLELVVSTRPPPRRPPPFRPPPSRSNVVDMDSFIDAFGDLLGEDEPDFFDAENEVRMALDVEMALLLTQLDFDSSDSSDYEIIRTRYDISSPFCVGHLSCSSSWCFDSPLHFASWNKMKLLHAYTDGRLEEVVLRHLGSDDGSTVIAKDIRLSEFLTNMHIR
ncbi:hypothetical protein CUMW_025730 [Citrus unshiu]|nr:hypothetical protein CUMW_025730 [Citrus unshiu]